MEIYSLDSVDSTESPEKQKNPAAKYYPKQDLNSEPLRNLDPYNHAQLTPTKYSKSKNQ